MKRLLLTINLLLATTLFINVAQAQSYTTISKSCGSCGGAVSSSSRIGQRCPHCGVIWGRENTHGTTSRTSTNNSNSNSDNMFELSSTTSNCNLRSGPGTKSVILGAIAKNESIIINQRSGDWVKVTFLGNFMDGSGYSSTIHIGWLHIKTVVL